MDGDRVARGTGRSTKTGVLHLDHPRPHGPALLAEAAAREGQPPIPLALVFDRLVVNPKRGAMDFYTKAWPVVVGGFLALSMVSAAMKPPATAYGGDGAGTTTSTPIYAAPALNAHMCWADASGSLVGCTMTNGRIVGVRAARR